MKTRIWIGLLVVALGLALFGRVSGIQGQGTKGAQTPHFLPLVAKQHNSAATATATATMLPTLAPATVAPSATGASPEPTATTSPTATYTTTATATATATPTVEPTPISTFPAFFLPNEVNGAQNTFNASVEVDPLGGVHVAYERFPADESSPELVYYAYCASVCDSHDDFAAIPVGGDDEGVNHLNLAVDAQGRPRLLWHAAQGFRYAECNASCLNSASWSIATVAQLDTFTGGSHRMFALDPQGHPRFVFSDDTAGDHFGTFFMSCDAECKAAVNWHEVRISSIYAYEEPSLAITSGGFPRFAFRTDIVQGGNAVTRLGYAECNAACGAAAGWQGVLLDPVHVSDSSLSLQLNSDDKPRLAVSTGPIEPGSRLAPKETYYFWCDVGCGDYKLAEWNDTRVNLPGAADKNVALALDAEDRPRLAYEGANPDGESGMIYAWCDLNCESAEAEWRTMLVDSTDALNRQHPAAPPPGCATPSWRVGYQVSLALDATGDPRMVYDARRLSHCNSPEPYTDFARARIASFDQP